MTVKVCTDCKFCQWRDNRYYTSMAESNHVCIHALAVDVVDGSQESCCVARMTDHFCGPYGHQFEKKTDD